MKKIESLNLIRIFAMGLVICFHAKIHYGFTLKNTYVNDLVSIGAIGCTIFFVLSGFTLRYNYKNKNIDKIKDFNTFIFKRLISLYPVYLVLLIYGYIANIFEGGVPIRRLLALIPVQLLTVFPAISNYVDNSNFWFISTLLVLYSVFPFLNKIINELSLKRKMQVIILLIVISEYLYYLSIKLGNVHLEYYVNPILRIPEFLVGILLADVFEGNIRMDFNREYKSILLILLLFLGKIYVVHLLMPYLKTYYNLYNL